ncbi:MAG: YSC84-related protein [Terriglobales bacterium]|jgi:lipid-binding SYLF domain-containing protein
MKKLLMLIAAITLLATAGWADDNTRTKELDRVQASQTVLHEIMSAPDKGIPRDILAASDCVAVIPSMVKGGFVFGANYGKGIATCRYGDNRWSAPAPIKIEGGSWGLQIGVQGVDLVMTILNRKGMDQLLSSKFKLGADASVAAGPVGREASGDTDWKMRAEALTYSRARGVFAGITLNGAVLVQDRDDTEAMYGKDASFKNILTGQVPAPAETQPFVDEVARYFSAAKAHEKARADGLDGTQAAELQRVSATGNAGSLAAQDPQQNSQVPASTMKLSREQVKSNIENALQNTKGLSSSKVTVSVTDETVALTGSVPSERDKAAIDRIAMDNASGRQVDDSGLSVK